MITAAPNLMVILHPRNGRIVVIRIRKISLENISAMSHFLWSDGLIADRIALESMEILEQAYKRNSAFFNGKGPRNLIGGLLYLLGFRHDYIKRQNEIASTIGTSDVTIRGSYRDWLETFPDLFLDVTNKLLLDKDRRTYVLLNCPQALA